MGVAPLIYRSMASLLVDRPAVTATAKGEEKNQVTATGEEENPAHDGDGDEPAEDCRSCRFWRLTLRCLQTTIAETAAAETDGPGPGRRPGRQPAARRSGP